MIYEEVTRSSESTTTSDSYHEIKNRWHSAEDVRNVPKCNIQKQRLQQPQSNCSGGGGDASLQQCHQDVDSTTSKRNSSERSIDRYSCGGSNKEKHLKKVCRYSVLTKGQLFYIISGFTVCSQTFSFRDKRNDIGKMRKCRNQDPPIITTTAATPQDSPNTTLEPGSSFKHWDSIDLEKLEKVTFLFVIHLYVIKHFFPHP